MSPLSHERLAIVLAVAESPKSASEIYYQAVGDSVGEISLKGSTLYACLRELTELGFFEHRNQAYWLTERGWKAVEQEAYRTERWSILAKQRLREKRYAYSYSQN